MAETYGSYHAKTFQGQPVSPIHSRSHSRSHSHSNVCTHTDTHVHRHNNVCTHTDTHVHRHRHACAQAQTRMCTHTDTHVHRHNLADTHVHRHNLAAAASFVVHVPLVRIPRTPTDVWCSVHWYFALLVQTSKILPPIDLTSRPTPQWTRHSPVTRYGC